MLDELRRMPGIERAVVGLPEADGRMAALHRPFRPAGQTGAA